MKSPIKKKPRYSSTEVPLPASRRTLKFAIDGNIAAGKSTLIDALKNTKPKWNVVQEPVAKWTNVANDGVLTSSQKNGGNLLKMFYDDKQRWSYTFQSYALFSKLRLHSKPVLIPGDVTGPVVNIYERSYYSDRYIFAENCFEQGFMHETEWDIYKEWCDYLVESLGGYDLDALIYLRASPEVCVSRRMQRGRPEEKDIPMDYIESLHEKHESLFVNRDIVVNDQFNRLPVLVIDCGNDYNKVLLQTLSYINSFLDKSKPKDFEILDSAGNSEEIGSDLEL